MPRVEHIADVDLGKHGGHFVLPLQEEAVDLDPATAAVVGVDGRKDHLERQVVGRVADNEASQRHDPPGEERGDVG